MKKVCIVVPIYKKRFNKDEEYSISNLFKVLGKYDIYAFCPKSLDLSYYKEKFNFKKFHKFNDWYFEVFPKGYNRLMTNPHFYERFANYEFILIHQPDCWVFKDMLEYWCDKNYDLIGSMLYVTNVNYLVNKKYKGYNFNGGFSLRKIKFFIKMCKKFKNDKQVMDINEDIIYRSLVNRNMMKCHLPESIDEVLSFSWDDNPHLSYYLCRHKLPFGVHKYKSNYFQVFWDLMKFF